MTISSTIAGSFAEHLGGRVVRDVEIEQHAPLIHAAEVAQAALQQIAVADDDLLAGHAAHARRLEADVLDDARDLVDADVVADVERLVEHDRQRGEQIAEDVLHRERDGDAADAEAGDQRRDRRCANTEVSAVMTTRIQSSTLAPTPIALIIATLAAVALVRAARQMVLHPERDRRGAPDGDLPQHHELRRAE